jgi:membrane protease YdiL (CAAX protease family)
MLVDARFSLSPDKKFSIPIEILIFLLVAAIASLPQTVLTSIVITFIMLFDPKFIELIGSGELSQAAILEYQAEFMSNLPSYIYAIMLFASGFIILAAILYCKLFQKRRAHTLGFTKNHAPKEYLMGAAIGLIMITLPTLACLATGCVSLKVSESINPLVILLFFAAFLFQGMGEEALFRGYLMTSLARGANIWTAIITSSLIFSIFHISNESFGVISFINIFLFGVFAAVFMLKRGSIWAVGAIHSLWNFAQGNIFGFNVSGNPKFDSVFEVASTNHGVILSGGEFGLEGGLGATIVLLIAILGALAIPTKKSEYVESMTFSRSNTTTQI